MISFSVRRPIAVFMVCVGLLVLGVLSAQKIPMQLMPPMERPEFLITADFRGAGPQEVEEQVTWPLERAIATTPGIDSVESVSLRERAAVRVKLRPNVSLLDTLSILRDRVDGAGFPEAVGKARIERTGAQQEPLFRLAFSQQNTESLLGFAERLRDTWVRELERVPGVALAALIGSPRRVLDVTIAPAKLEAYGLSLSGVAQTIQAQSKLTTIGDIEEGGKRLSLKIGSSSGELRDLMDLVVRRVDDKAIHLKDVATVRMIESRPEQVTHFNGKPSLILELRKESGANSVVVSKGIREVLERLRGEDSAPEVEILYDEGELIEAAVTNVQSSVEQGAVLAALCVYFLVQSLWPTFVVTIIIPLSLFLTLIGMHFFGVTFNLMSLSGLALGVGMLVDSSMVVLESINQEGLETYDKADAALRGTQRVSGAITGSTLATIAVFAPLAFIGGTVGQVFRDVALTVTFCLLSSLFVAISVIPMLSSLDLAEFRFSLPSDGSGENGAKPTLPDLAAWRGASIGRRYWETYRALIRLTGYGFRILSLHFFMGVKRMLVPLRRGSALLSRLIAPAFLRCSQGLSAVERVVREKVPVLVRNPRKPLMVTVGLTLLGIGFISRLGSELFPEDEAAGWVFRLEFPSGQTAVVTEAKVQEIEKSLRLTRLFERVASVIGFPTAHEAKLLLTPNAGSGYEAAEGLREVLSRVPELSSARVSTSLVSAEKPIRLEVFHPDLQALSVLGKQAESAMRKVSGLEDFESDLKPPLREIEIRFRKPVLDFYELEAPQFLAPLRSSLQGESGGLVQLMGKDAEVRVSLRDRLVTGVQSLQGFSIPSGDRRTYLASVANVREVSTPSLIRHIDRKRVTTVGAGLDGIDMEAAAARIQNEVKKVWASRSSVVPADYRIGGGDLERRQTRDSLLGAVAFSVFLIFLLLAGQFESLTQPLIVLLAVPLCLSGMGISLWLFSTPISALVLVGFVILVGSSVNTSIVMVDFANQIRATGVSAEAAIQEAAIKRLRPILITTLTNILGLLPMITASGPGAAMQRPIALTLVGGLVSSTVLSYFVIPLAYSRMDRK